MIQQVSAATPHPTLVNSVLPRATKGRAHGLASHIFRRPDYVLAKCRVAVKEQEPVCSRVRPCFPHLLNDPQSTRISRDAVAKDLAPVVADDKKAIQNPKVSVGTVKKSIAAIAAR